MRIDPNQFTQMTAASQMAQLRDFIGPKLIALMAKHPGITTAALAGITDIIVDVYIQGITDSQEHAIGVCRLMAAIEHET